MLSDYTDLKLTDKLIAPEDMKNDESPEPLRSVQVDGLTIMKILQHAQTCVPEHVYGHLLGVGHSSVLEVTHCYPLRLAADDTEENSQNEQTRVQTYLQQVNADVLVIGWYSVSNHESHGSLPFIDTMYLYQQDLGEHSVCLVIDPVKSLHGKLYLKAMRLKPEFMKMYEENKDKGGFSQSVVNTYQVTSADVFQEVPITISNSHHIDQFLWELGTSPTYAVGTTEEDIVSAEQVLTQYQTLSATAMVEQTDSLLNELNKYMQLSRARKDESRDREAKPSRLETLALSYQLNNISRHMCDVSHVAFESTALWEALQQAQQAGNM